MEQARVWGKWIDEKSAMIGASAQGLFEAGADCLQDLDSRKFLVVACD
jgi:hypothetical protein